MLHSACFQSTRTLWGGIFELGSHHNFIRGTDYSDNKAITIILSKITTLLFHLQIKAWMGCQNVLHAIMVKFYGVHFWPPNFSLYMVLGTDFKTFVLNLNLSPCNRNSTNTHLNLNDSFSQPEVPVTMWQFSRGPWYWWGSRYTPVVLYVINLSSAKN